MANFTTVNASQESPGSIVVKNGSVTTLWLWTYSIESVSESIKTPGASNVQLKSETYFLVEAPVDAIVSAIAAAQQLWVREERNLAAVKTKAA